MKKAVIFGPQRATKPPKQTAPITSAATQTCEGSEPLMFSFDEDLEREEKQRRYTAPVQHLCTRPAQYVRWLGKPEARQGFAEWSRQV